MANKKFYADVIVARERASEVAKAYLYERGWEYVCDLPGAQWLWRKRVRDRVVTVDTDSALYMQSNMDTDE